MTFLSVLRPKISTANSSTASLGTSGTYTGTSEDVTDYASATVFVSTNASGELFIEFSTDEINWELVQSETINANQPQAFTVEVKVRYFRVRYENGGNAQSFFRLASLLNPYKPALDGIQEALNDIETNTSNFINTTITTTPQNTLIDAFGRQKVSNPQTLIDNKFLTSKNIIDWDELTKNGGQANFSIPGYIQLIAPPSGGRVVRQSRLYTPYQPGKGLSMFITGTLETNGGATDVTSRIGYFDDDADKTDSKDNTLGNGYFFELDGNDLSVVERTSVSGGQTDNKVVQNNWNIDPMNGTGPSGIVLDVSKRQIFYIELEWLGVGTVVMGLVIDRQLYFVHAFHHANTLGLSGTGIYPYINTPTLPIRYEITNNSSGGASMVQICSTVISDGGYTPIGKVSSIANSDFISGVGSSTLIPILSIRLAPQKRRLTARLLNFTTVESGGRTYAYEIFKVVSPTSGVLTNSTSLIWTSVGGDSNVQYNENATGLTLPAGNNYIRLVSGLVSGQSRGVDLDFGDTFAATLTSNIAGESDLIIIACRTLSGTVNIAASLGWQEIE